MKQLIGHIDTQQKLWDMLESGRFPHAVLFHGSKGIGKRLLAEKLAYLMLCGGICKDSQLIVNEDSPLFLQLKAGACPDYHVIEVEEKMASIKVDQIRRLLDKLSLFADAKRVIIIDSTDEMGTEAANTLLKTLEEPGINIHFILISHNLFKVLPTILSRSRKMKISSLTKKETLQVLQKESDITKSNAEKIDYIACEKLADMSNGSPGMAITVGIKAIDIMENIEDALAGKKSPVNVADKVNQKKQVDLALSLLQHKLVEQIRQNPLQQGLSEKFSDLQKLRETAKTHNLSGNWVLEKAIRRMQ